MVLLANALNKATKEYGVPVTAAEEAMVVTVKSCVSALVILAPQVASNYEDMKVETDKLDIKLAKTEGAQYIKLTRDGQGALDLLNNKWKIKIDNIREGWGTQLPFLMKRKNKCQKHYLKILFSVVQQRKISS